MNDGKTPSSLFLTITSLAFVVIFALSLWGLSLDQHDVCNSSKDTCRYFALWVDRIVQVLQFFTLNESIEKPGENVWQLVVARLGAALFVFVGVLIVLGRVFRKEVIRILLSRKRGHVVIAGFSDHACFFAESCLESTKKSIVFVDADPDGTVAAFAALHNFWHLKASAKDKNALSAVNLQEVDQLIIASNNDDTNIEICHEVQLYLSESCAELKETILVVQDIRLVEELERNNPFMRMMERDLDIIFFNPVRVTARALLRQAQFAGQSLMRDQPRMAIVLFGMTQTAIEVAIEFLRISPCVDLERPRIDWFVSDKEALRGLALNRNEALGHLLLDNHQVTENEPLGWAVDIHVHQLNSNAVLPSMKVINHVSAAHNGSTTGIILAQKYAKDNLTTALSLNDRLLRSAVWQAPIYVHVPHRTSLESLFKVYKPNKNYEVSYHLRDLEKTDNLDQVVEPFGALVSLCRIATLRDKREDLAKEIHDAYRLKRKTDKSETSSSVDRDESLKPWAELAHTFKLSNRRAADHVQVKLAGILKKIPPTNVFKLPISAIDNEELFSKLAAVEHDSWRIDRELDGWRFGERNEEKKQHPDLVQYDRLRDGVEELDRSQIIYITTGAS